MESKDRHYFFRRLFHSVYNSCSVEIISLCGRGREQVGHDLHPAHLNCAFYTENLHSQFINRRSGAYSVSKYRTKRHGQLFHCEFQVTGLQKASEYQCEQYDFIIDSIFFTQCDWRSGRICSRRDWAAIPTGRRVYLCIPLLGRVWRCNSSASGKSNQTSLPETGNYIAIQCVHN